MTAGRLRVLDGVGTGTDVSTTSGPVGVDVLALAVLLGDVLREDLPGVGTEVVTLGLEEVGGEDLGAVSVEEGEGGGEGRGGDAPKSGLGDDAAPSRLGLVDGLVEEVVEEQVLELGVLGVSVGDVTKEDTADDASSAPHEGDSGVVQVPLVLLGGLTHEHESLGVRDELGGVEGLLEVVDELLLVTGELLDLRSAEELAGTGTLGLDGREAAGEDGLADKGDGHAEVEGVDGGPLAGTLLASRVEDLLEEGSAILVVEVEDIAGDFDEERV